MRTFFPTARRGRHVRTLLASLALLWLPIVGLAQVTLGQEAKLFDPTPPTTQARAGSATAISGNTAVVGAPNLNSGAGAVYVYQRDALSGTWALQQTLVAGDAAAGDGFGAAVAVSGDNIAVGAPGRSASRGAVYTFKRSGTTWSQGTILTASAAAAGDKLGFSVAIEGLTIAAGAPYATVGSRVNEGTAYVFTSLDGGLNWQQQFQLVVTTGQAQGGDHIGWSVALSQGTVVAGAPDDNFGNKTSAGTAYVFVRSGSTWSKQARLNPGAVANMRVGSAVALQGNTAVLGAPGSAGSKGKAYVYTRSGTTWTLAASLAASDGTNGDGFGSAVADSGKQVIVGAPGGGSTGKAYLFSNAGGSYSQAAFLVASDSAAGDAFGSAVAEDAGRALVGAPSNAAGGTLGNGAAYTFVTASASTTAITAIAPEPSGLGQSYAVSVQVAASPVGPVVPGGSVSVSDGIGANCTVTLDAGGGGSCNLASSTAGTVTVSADYSGDALFGASSATAIHSVSPGATSTTITAVAPEPSLVGQPFSVSVGVAAAPPAVGTPTGAVTVSAGAASCTVPDIALGNSCQLTLTSAGSVNLVASYAGDADFAASSSAAVAHAVNKADTTAVVVSANPNPSAVGEAVTVTASVTALAPGAGTPSGAVTLSTGASNCTIPDIASANACQLAFPTAGAGSVSASYAGDANFNPSQSPSLPHTTAPAATVTTITADGPDPSVPGQNVTVSVSVQAQAPGAGTPSGAVTISNDVEAGATCTIPDVAVASSCTVSLSGLGSSQFTASYAGDGNFAASVSQPEAHSVIQPPPSRLAFVQQPVDVPAGERMGTMSVEVRDGLGNVVTGDNSTQVTLTLASTPCGSTITLGPVTVVNGVATFSGLGPKFRTLTSGLQWQASSTPTYTADTSTTFAVVANPSLVFAGDFESCRP